MARTWTILLTVLLVLGASALACGAIADIVGEDGGQPDAGTTLVFDPYEVIRQGDKRTFLISFADPPPWADSGSNGFLTVFRFVDEADESKILDDIGKKTDYDGVQTIDAIFIATRDAQTGPRLLIVRAAFEETGKPQQFHEGRGTFWVLERTASDGGTD